MSFDYPSFAFSDPSAGSSHFQSNSPSRVTGGSQFQPPQYRTSVKNHGEANWKQHFRDQCMKKVKQHRVQLIQVARESRLAQLQQQQQLHHHQSLVPNGYSNSFGTALQEIFSTTLQEHIGTFPQSSPPTHGASSSSLEASISSSVQLSQSDVHEILEEMERKVCEDMHQSLLGVVESEETENLERQIQEAAEAADAEVARLEEEQNAWAEQAAASASVHAQASAAYNPNLDTFDTSPSMSSSPSPFDSSPSPTSSILCPVCRNGYWRQIPVMLSSRQSSDNRDQRANFNMNMNGNIGSPQIPNMPRSYSANPISSSSSSSSSAAVSSSDTLLPSNALGLSCSSCSVHLVCLHCSGMAGVSNTLNQFLDGHRIQLNCSTTPQFKVISQPGQLAYLGMFCATCYFQEKVPI